MKKLRFILLKEDIEIGRYQNIRMIAEVIGCTYQYVYKNKKDVFKYKKDNYKVIDRLEDLN